MTTKRKAPQPLARYTGGRNKIYPRIIIIRVRRKRKRFRFLGMTLKEWLVCGGVTAYFIALLMLYEWAITTLL